MKASIGQDSHRFDLQEKEKPFILGGIVFGLLTSPRKNTTIGSNNGNNSPCGNGLKAGKKAGDWDEIEKAEENRK